MTSYSWMIDAIAQLESDQRELAADLPDIADEVVAEWGQETRAFLKGRGYPPAPAPKKGRKPYRRTGLLANKWTARREGRGIARLFNEAASKGKRYAGYVIGDDVDQAYMHEGRWWQADKEIANREPLLDQKLTRRLDERLG